jgi:hypothetical protein
MKHDTMKYIIFATIVIFTSCRMGNLNKTYYYIDPGKEWDIFLTLNEDSTFVIQDTFGCNNFKFTGKWENLSDKGHRFFRLNDQRIWVHDPIRGFYYSNDLNLPIIRDVGGEGFKYIKMDTLYYSYFGKVKFRGLTFKRKSIFVTNNLGRKRAKISKNKLVAIYGRRVIIEMIGDGVSMKKALERIEKCTPPTDPSLKRE